MSKKRRQMLVFGDPPERVPDSDLFGPPSLSYLPARGSDDGRVRVKRETRGGE